MDMSVGRGVFWKKTQVSDCLKLDILSITKKCDLETAVHGTSSWKNSWGEKSEISILFYAPEKIQLSYTITKKQDDEKKYLDYYVYLDTTPCNFGGKRWWFLCPNCNRRRRILYLPPGATYFLCRICHNLTYESQQEGKTKWSPLFDAINKIPKLENQLLKTRSPKRHQRIERRLEDRATDGRKTRKVDVRGMRI
jgi:hypothetical protein